MTRGELRCDPTHAAASPTSFTCRRRCLNWGRDTGVPARLPGARRRGLRITGSSRGSDASLLHHNQPVEAIDRTLGSTVGVRVDDRRVPPRPGLDSDSLVPVRLTGRIGSSRPVTAQVSSRRCPASEERHGRPGSHRRNVRVGPAGRAAAYLWLLGGRMVSWSPDEAEASGYTHDELAILYEIAEKHRVPAEVVLRMIREENAYYEMGRRRGLFPALHQIINDVTEGRF